MDSRFLAGIGVSGISFFARYAVKDMPRPIAWLGVLFGVLIMAASTSPVTSKFINGPIIMLALGCFFILGSAVWFYFGDSSSAFASTKVAEGLTPSVTQNNQSGPNLNVPGNNNTFNFPPAPIPAPAPTPAPTRDPDGIYQFDRQVGSVTLADPNPSAGYIQFGMISAGGDFNPKQEFEYRDYILNTRYS